MEINREKLEKGAKELGIRLVVLFGSRAKGAARKDSDYDIGILTTKDKNISNMENYTKTLFFLCDALGVPDYKTDLTNINKANPLLLQQIFSTGKLLFGDRIDFDEYRSMAYREYMDAKPLFELERKIIHKRQQLLSKEIQSI